MLNINTKGEDTIAMSACLQALYKVIIELNKEQGEKVIEEWFNMAKLYPPYISGTLPAFCKENGDFYLEIPFSMNPGVGKGDISGFALIIKDVLGS